MDHAAIIAAGEADYFAERAEGAKQKLGTIEPIDLLPPAERVRAELLRLRCDGFLGEPVDRIILDARTFLARTNDQAERADFHAQIAYCYVAKRCQALAHREAATIGELLPESSLGPSVQGWIHLRFDRREEAGESYAEATRRTLPWRGHLGLARVAFVAGDFDRTLDELDRVEQNERTRTRTLRIRADVARVRSDWPRFLEVQEAILEHTSGGFRTRRDQLERASALFALGKREDGLQAYRRVWRENEDDWAGRFAREVLDHVERGEESSRRIMLETFPTVTQKRNYCGPATLELVLRSLGIEATQDDIAPEVKGERGSPILMMTRYLESRDLEVRRFEGTGARFRACIELGLPVIVEEEYSISSHVAVVIGVDEELGLLFVQDPMTHVTSERLITTERHLGALYRNAAIVAFRKGDRENQARLDEADVRDLEHLRLVDRCGDPGIEGKPEEILRLCSRAVELCEDFPLAWHRQAFALFNQFRRFRTPNNRARFLAMLRSVRVRYPEQEWPHQVHAHFLMDDGRFEEALIEYEEALRLDPGDSNNAQNIAECNMEMRRPREAMEAFWKTLAIDPAHIRATENFAALALDEGDVDLAEHLSTCALEMAPRNPFNPLTASRVAKRQGRDDDALRLARQAVEIAPDYSSGLTHLAGLLRFSGLEAERDEALDLYRQCVQRWPYWFEPRRRAAAMLEERGEADEGCRLLIEGIDISQDEPDVLVRDLVETLREQGKDREALEYAQRFARQRPTVNMLGVFFDTLENTESERLGTEETRKFFEGNPKSPYGCVRYAIWLLGAEDMTEAEKLLRQAVEGAPTYVWARQNLMYLLSIDRPQEAVEIASRAPEPDPWLYVDWARIENDLGHHDQALELLRTARDLKGDPGWRLQEQWNLAVLGRDDPGDVLKRLEDSDDPADLLARIFLACGSGRHDQALALLDRVPVDDSLSRVLVMRAADGSDAYRPEVEKRFRHFMEKAATSYPSRRWAEAILVGNAAALGERGPFDAYLAREKNIRHLGNVMSTLNVVRQPGLTRAVREAIASSDAELSRVHLEKAYLLAHRGQHTEAVAALRVCLERWPRNAGTWSFLAAELLLADEEEGHRAAERASRIPRAWVWTNEILAASHLLRGNREEAARQAGIARWRWLANGYTLEEHAFLQAVQAVLQQDREALDRARLIHGAHHDPDSTMWGKMSGMIG